MIALAAAIRENWHAVERDLATMQLDADDIGTAKLPEGKLISIVLAAPYTTWNRTEELLATISEQHSGVVKLNARYARPQVDSTPIKAPTELSRMQPYRGITLDSLPVDEFTARLKERQRQAREEAQTS